MKLSIVIPAFNEEEAIGSTIERCIEARQAILDGSPITDVEIVVVSDGSTDRTAAIAGGYEQIRLIEFARNRGYGAAIKRGFEESDGEIVGFLDADGTCEPAFFATLCRALIDESASVAIGSRMGPESKMPSVRRLGNRIYAAILSALSNQAVTDTASGMRAIRRDVLERLYPLPDGLHFTPAMSARVLMDDRLTIVERPMSYEERVGESKLHVFRDGVRFLHVIFQMSLMWRPAKMFAATSLLCLAIMTMLALHPLETWLRYGGFHEDMIYRLLICGLMGMVGITLLSAAVVSDHVHRLLKRATGPRTFVSLLMDKVYSLGGFGVALVGSLPIMIWLIGEGVWTRLADGYVAIHWSRVVLASVVSFGLAQMLATVLIVNVIRFHNRRRQESRRWISTAKSETHARSTPTSSVLALGAKGARSRVSPPQE